MHLVGQRISRYCTAMTLGGGGNGALCKARDVADAGREIGVSRKPANGLRIAGTIPEAMTACREALPKAERRGNQHEQAECCSPCNVVHAEITKTTAYRKRVRQ